MNSAILADIAAQREAKEHWYINVLCVFRGSPTGTPAVMRRIEAARLACGRMHRPEPAGRTLPRGDQACQPSPACPGTRLSVTFHDIDIRGRAPRYGLTLCR
jgi:hypothetical protein